MRVTDKLVIGQVPPGYPTQCEPLDITANWTDAMSDNPELPLSYKNMTIAGSNLPAFEAAASMLRDPNVNSLYSYVIQNDPYEPSHPYGSSFVRILIADYDAVWTVFNNKITLDTSLSEEGQGSAYYNIAFNHNPSFNCRYEGEANYSILDAAGDVYGAVYTAYAQNLVYDPSYTGPEIPNFPAAGGGGVSSGIKMYDGSSYVDAPLRRWDGEAWVDKQIKKWTGSDWE